MVSYSYSTPEQQNSKIPYSFVEYEGNAFLQAYLKTRKEALERITIASSNPKSNPISLKEMDFSQPIEINKLLWALLAVLEKEDYLSQSEIITLFKTLRKRGELGKLKASYLGRELKTHHNIPAEIDDYVILSVCLCLDYKKTKSLQSLSTLLKINDRIITFFSEVNELSLVKYSIDVEMAFIIDLKEELRSKKINERLSLPIRGTKEKQILYNVGMIVQDKVRTRAYLQIMIAAGLLPNYVIILDDQKQPEKLDKSVEGLDYFNSSESLIITLKSFSIPFMVIFADNFNEQRVVNELRKRKELYFIFSGSGILKEVLSAGKKLIHAHPGRLPDFRGSTTFLYSLLAEGKCEVTTFIMNDGIDTGNILIIREFPPPAANVDISRIYDPYIRSQAIVETLQQLLTNNLLEGKRQDPQEGETYFMIHPILRTLAVGYYTGDINNFNI